MYKNKISQQRYRPFRFKQQSNACLIANKASSRQIYFWVAYTLNQKTISSSFFLTNLIPINKQSFVFTGAEKKLICNINLLACFFSVSLNSYAKLHKEGIRLPSGELLKQTSFLKTELFEKKQTKQSRSKSSYFFFKKLKQTVKGVSKNAVDHKHGGKGRGGVLRGF